MIVRKAILYFILVAAPMIARAGEPVKMVKPLDYPTVGIALGVPADYKPAPLKDANQVFNFVSISTTNKQITKHDQAKDFGKSITLWVFSAHPEDSAKKFIENHALLTRSQKLEKVKILSTTPLRIDGLDGLARSLSYEQGGRKISAVSVVFIRSLEIPASLAFRATGIKKSKTIRLAYILRMELPETQKDVLLPTFDQIVKTIAMIDLRRPIEVPIEFSTVEKHTLHNGLVIPALVGWFPKIHEQSITWIRPDFVTLSSGGAITVSSQRIAFGENLETLGLADIVKEQKENANIKIISQGSINNAFQFVLEKTLTLPPSKPTTQLVSQPDKLVAHPGKSAPPLIKVRRFIYNPNVKPGKSQCVVLTFVAQGCDVARAEEIMNSLAGGIFSSPPAKLSIEKNTSASQPATVKSQP